MRGETVFFRWQLGCAEPRRAGSQEGGHTEEAIFTWYIPSTLYVDIEFDLAPLVI
jgi:hypothetical protein